MNNIVFSCFLIFILIVCPKFNGAHYIKVSFFYEEKQIYFGNDLEMYLIINNQHIRPLLCTNSFIVPDLKSNDTVGLGFKYKRLNLYFGKIPIAKFTVSSWKVVIDKKPFIDKEPWYISTKKCKILHYIYFEGDETTVQVNCF